MNLLRSSHDFRRLFASRVVSDLGTWFATIALTIAVYDDTHSPIWVSLLLLLGLAPAMIFGFTLAPLLDRLERRRVLIGAELAGAVAFLGAAASQNLVALLVFAGAAAIAGAAFRPGLSAALPTLVADDELAVANGLMRSASCIAIIAGPPLAGVLVAAVGPSPVFLLNAVSFAVSALLVARIPRERLQASRRLAERVAGGSSALFSTPALRSIVASWSLAQFTWCVTNVGEVLIARNVFHAGDVGYGVLAGCSGVGLLAGSLGLGRMSELFSDGTLYRAALALAGIGLAVAAGVHSFPIALVAVTAAATGNALAIGSASLTIQRTIERDRLGEAFGIFQAVYSVAATAGMVAAGPVIEAVGIRDTWTIGGAVALVAAVLAWLLAQPSLPFGFPSAGGERFPVPSVPTLGSQAGGGAAPPAGY